MYSCRVLDLDPDKATEQLSRQIDQLSRDVERLTAQWRTMQDRLVPLLEVAERFTRGNKWWMGK